MTYEIKGQHVVLEKIAVVGHIGYSADDDCNLSLIMVGGGNHTIYDLTFLEATQHKSKIIELLNAPSK